MMATNAEYEVVELGYYTPEEVKVDSLKAGEVGYISASIKSIDDVKVGDIAEIFGKNLSVDIVADKAQTIKITETQRGQRPLCVPVISIGLSITCFLQVPTRSRHSSGDTSCRCCKGLS